MPSSPSSSAAAAAPSPPPENPPPPPSQPQPQPQPPVAVRKFPAPCWTQDETLALIHVYQDKWFSLRRRNLRTADWEAVADEVNRRCPHQSPPKTSSQCRHKMEKLRKRYRTEKQRITNLPVPVNHHHHHPQFMGMGNNFFPSSSWVFFDLMDAMEIGSAPASASGSTPLVAITTTTTAANVHIPPKEKDGLNFMNHNLQNGGFAKEEKPTRGKEDLGKYFDEILMSVGKGGIGGAPIKFKVKNSNSNNNERYFDDSKYDCDYDGSGGGGGGGFDYNTSGRNFGAASASASGFNYNSNSSNKRKMSGGGFVNGCSSKRGPAARGRRGEGAVGEMVASINMLGDGLLKMEKMKMEMMQDLQRQRMEMEINNSKMILESQHSIVNAFLQGFNKLNKANKLMQLD